MLRYISLAERLSTHVRLCNNISSSFRARPPTTSLPPRNAIPFFFLVHIILPMTCSGEKPSAAVAGCIMQFHVRRIGGSSAGRQSRVPRTAAAHRPAVCDRRAREFHLGPAPRSIIAHIATRAARENLCRFDDDRKGAPGGECTRTPVVGRPARSRAYRGRCARQNVRVRVSYIQYIPCRYTRVQREHVTSDRRPVVLTVLLYNEGCCRYTILFLAFCQLQRGECV
uniref:Uncharacterized protein n=1 Tax=Schizaphis graminum TaxID=13262 RepID=A0A2S2NQ40_SCHGA